MSFKINIGDRVLKKFSKKPEIALVVDSYFPIAEIIDFKGRGATLLEIRFDLLTESFDKKLEYVKEIKEKTSMGIIGTLRENRENIDNRISLFTRLIPFVDAVDIEIDAEITKEVVKIAKNYEKVVIISEHDFNKMPSVNELDMLVEKSLSLGADIVKIAAMASTIEETARIMNYTYSSETPLITIAMGELGGLSRVAGGYFGSLYTYTVKESAVAPGQLAFNTLIKEIGKYYH